jgi:2-haloacid dehalogenase
MTSDPATSQTVIVFDLGGVLIDWDPRHLFRKLSAEETALEHSLTGVCAPAGNAEQDRGRLWADAVAELSASHPEHKELIEAYHARWDEMLGGPVDGTVRIVESLAAAGYRLHALTNWSAETFPVARARYPFLERFETILVSGEERLMKPEAAIFELMLSRIGHQAEVCIFIDDSAKNIEAATALGFDAIRFEGPEALRTALAQRGIRVDAVSA